MTMLPLYFCFSIVSAQTILQTYNVGGSLFTTKISNNKIYTLAPSTFTKLDLSGNTLHTKSFPYGFTGTALAVTDDFFYLGFLEAKLMKYYDNGDLGSNIGASASVRCFYVDDEFLYYGSDSRNVQKLNLTNNAVLTTYQGMGNPYAQIPYSVLVHDGKVFAGAQVLSIFLCNCRTVMSESGIRKREHCCNHLWLMPCSRM
jgi:hypothetical protein